MAVLKVNHLTGLGPFRLGMSPLPYVCCVAGFAAGSITIG
jgi:hypothetical protein